MPSVDRLICCVSAFAAAIPFVSPFVLSGHTSLHRGSLAADSHAWPPGFLDLPSQIPARRWQHAFGCQCRAGTPSAAR